MSLFVTVTVYVLAGLLGVCVGSFLNVVIYRVPIGESLSHPSSHCPKCGRALHWYDNIPLLSYLILRGKCRNCGERISFRYFAVELSNLLLWLLSVFLFWEKSIFFAVIAAVTSSVLLCVFFIDLDHGLIPDRFVVILGILGVAAVFLDPHYGWLSHLLGGGIGLAVFWGIAFIYYKIKGREGLGGGDIKLTAVCGLLLGWERLLLSVLVASVVACVVLGILSRKKRKQHEEEQEGAEKKRKKNKNGKKEEESDEYPFAPFLSTAFAIALFFGNDIISAYWSLLSI